MKVEAVNIAGGAATPLPAAADKVADARKKKDEPVQEIQDTAKPDQVPPEELLKQIKGLAQDGLFSVRFENDDAANQLVVKIVDRETDEIIRQVPAEEVLDLRATLEDLRGNLVNTQS